MDGHKPGSRDYPEGFPRDPPLVPRGTRDVSWPAPPTFANLSDRQTFLAPPPRRYGPYLGHSPDGNALAAAHAAYFQMRHPASPSGLPPFMPGMDRHPMIPPQWRDFRQGSTHFPDDWPYGKSLPGYDPLRLPFEGKAPAPRPFVKEPEADRNDGEEPQAWKTNRNRSHEMRPPSARKSAEPTSSGWQSRTNAGSREGTPSRWLPGGSKPPVLDNCPICREPRPKKIKQGGTRCETTTPLRDKDGSIMYDKEGTAVTAQCPHVFVPPPSVSRDKDGEELATVSGQKQPLRQPDPFFHRLPKLPRTDDGFFRPPPQFMSDVRVHAGGAAPPREASPAGIVPLPFGPNSAAATVVGPVTRCPDCHFEYTELMDGKSCTNLVPSRNAKGENRFDKKGSMVMHPCGHKFASPEDGLVVKSKIELLSPELQGMLLKGKPRKLVQIENDFWKAVGKIEKELPNLGGGDVFVAMISFVTAAETTNSESVRFATCNLSDGSQMSLVLLRYCTGQYSKMIYGRPEFDEEIDRRLNSTLQQLAAAKEQSLQGKKKSKKKAKPSRGKNLKTFLDSIGLLDCHRQLEAKEFDLETLLMGSSTANGNPGLMTPEFLAEETGISLKAARKIMARAGKIRRKEKSTGTKAEKQMA